MSALVSGVGCEKYFDFESVQHEVLSNGNVEFSGNIKTIMTCNETILNGEIGLEIYATDGFIEQEFSETVETEILNYITDQSSYSEIMMVYDLIYEMPEEAPRFHYQAFVPTKTRIDFISIFLMPGPYGKLYVSLHEDDEGNPGNKITDLVIDDADNWITIRDRTVHGLAMLESSDGKSIPVTRNQKYHLNFSKTGMNPVMVGASSNDTYGVGDEFDSKIGLGNGDIVDSFMEADLIFETHTLLFTVPFEYTWEAPSFEKNTTLTYNFVLNGENRTGGDISSTSGEGEFELEGTGIPVVVNNTNITANTTQNSTNETVKKCPVCAQCSEWSYCSDGWQTRICEECDETEGKCVPSDDQRPCNEDSTMEEAFEAIRSAEEIVTLLAGKVDVSEAETLLKEANDDFDDGDYSSAYANAEEAKQIAIKTDPTIKEIMKEPTDWSGVLYSGILLVILFLVFKQRRLILGHASKYVPQLRGMSSDPSKVPVIENDNLYACDYCGNRVAYNKIRTYQGKNICTVCARKKDLL